ncbi:MAG: type 4b pilus protein PilO2 [Casimicrobium sp.]
MADVIFLTPKAFLFQGLTFVAGLEWLTESGLNRKGAEARARSFGNSAADNTYTTRAIDKRAYQFGTMASVEATRKSNVYSFASFLAAAATARKLAVTWAGVFQLDDTHWHFVSLRDGAILPYGDKIVLSKEEALQCLALARESGVETIVAPADFEVESALRLSLAEFLSSIKLRGRPEFLVFRPGDKAVKGTRVIVIPLLILVALAVGGGGWWYWEEEQAKAAARAAELRARAEAAKRPALRQIIPDPAWLKRPAARDVLSSCWNISQRGTKTPAGWAHAKTECSETSVVEFFDRRQGAGTVAALRAELPDVTIGESGASATVSKALSLADAPDEELLPLERARQEFLALAQAAYLSPALTASQSPQLPPPKQGQQFVAPTWRLRNFTLDGSLSDMKALAAPLGLPGLRVSKISFVGTRAKVEGTLYGN